METNKSLIKKIEKKHKVKLEFDEFGAYGLYCTINFDAERKNRVNVYDGEEIIAKKEQAYFLRVFLTEYIYQYL